MTARKITEEMGARIREGHAAGDSLNSIARALGVNPAAVSRWSKKEGIVWTGVPYAATVVKNRIAYSRTRIAEAALADALAIRERLWERHTIVVSTAAGPQRVVLDLPDAKATAEYAAAIERLIKTHQHLASYIDMTSSEASKSVLSQMHEALMRLAAESDYEDELGPPTPADDELESEAVEARRGLDEAPHDEVTTL
ncbi:hypothetical protein [Rhodococcus sp. HNM0569]|uniref:hypothetical protein n=1 Tax=Rhodococcus sp. HNM0569 TaxID=2716340 RepID=UPI00146E0C1C|nr:hypothetical protein [Rhodococcus sp. HNM0569]NLU81623.1 hypothetical protein [Rhodococcus sp. HNM0569]